MDRKALRASNWHHQGQDIGLETSGRQFRRFWKRADQEAVLGDRQARWSGRSVPRLRNRPLGLHPCSWAILWRLRVLQEAHLRTRVLQAASLSIILGWWHVRRSHRLHPLRAHRRNKRAKTGPKQLGQISIFKRFWRLQINKINRGTSWPVPSLWSNGH